MDLLLWLPVRGLVSLTVLADAGVFGASSVEARTKLVKITKESTIIKRIVNNFFIML